MLPKTAVVSVRKTLERGYTGTFTVTERQKVARDNHSTGFAEVQSQTSLADCRSRPRLRRGTAIRRRSRRASSCSARLR